MMTIDTKGSQCPKSSVGLGKPLRKLGKPIFQNNNKEIMQKLTI